MEKQLDSLQERFEASATRMEEKLEVLLTRMEVMLFSMQQPNSQQIQQSIPQSTPHLIPSIEVTNPNLTSTSLKGTPVKRKFPKFPFFKEGDPRKWICEIEEYFDFYEIPGVHKISESQKLNCATLHLRGRASQWFHRHIKPRIHEMSWSLFLEKLIDQFDSTELEDSNKSMVVDEVNVIDVVSCEKNRDGVVFDSLENLEMENYRSDKSSKVFDELENQGKEKLIDQFGILEIEIDDADLGRKIQEDVVVEDCDVVEGENQKDDKAAVALDKKNLTWETNLMDDYEEKFRTFSIVIEENEEKLMFAKKISKMSSSSVCGNVSNTIFPNLELRLSFRRNVKRAEFEVHTVVIGSDMVVLNGWPPPICKIDVEDEEDSVVHEIDVFYTPLEVDDAQLYLRPYWHPHELKESYKEVKVKPKSLEAEVILSVYLGSGNFNQDMLEVTMLHEQMLTSRRAFYEEEYTVGFVINNQLHLNPVSEVLQFWPSMVHLNGPGVQEGKNKCQEVDSKSEYLDSLCPRTPTLNRVAKVPSTSFFPLLPLEERLKKWPSQGCQVSRDNALKYLDVDATEEDFLNMLQHQVVLTQGLWVSKSSLIYELNHRNLLCISDLDRTSYS